MKTVILWVGNYKTGTSYQQSLFYKNVDVLNAAGIAYPRTPPYTGSHPVAAAWVKSVVPEEFYGGVAREAYARGLIEEALSQHDTLLLHSEVFTRVMFSPEAGQAFRALFGDGVRFRILFTTRRIEEMRNSLAVQMLKTGGPKKIGVYFGRNPGVAQDHMRVCNYIAAIKAFEAVFETTVEVMQYEALKSDPKGFARASFAALLPELGTGGSIAQPLPEESNASPSPIPTWIARQVVDDRAEIAEVAAALARKMGLEDPKSNTLLSRTSHGNLCAQSDRVNAALARRAARVGQVYVPYPASEHDKLVFRDEVDFDKWVAVASEIAPEIVREIARAPKPWLAGLGKRAADRIRRQFQGP